MKNAKVERVLLSDVDSSPFRNVAKYPYVERKIEALLRSIAGVGLWPGVIGRRVGNRVQISFGHHRVEAARRTGMIHIDIIIEDLTDEQMLQYMGRENMEDYNADFATMLETWEAAAGWLYIESNEYQPTVIARLLGWVKDRGSEGNQMSNTAVACNSAWQLMRDGHVERSDLHDMTVQEALNILGRASTNIKRIKEAGKKLGTPAVQIEAATKAVSKAIKTTTKQSREGTVAKKNLRGQVDVNAYKHAQSSKEKHTPLFSIFGKQLCDAIAKVLKSDVSADKLKEVINSLGSVTLDEDRVIVRRLDFELGELAERANGYQRKLLKLPAPVTPLSIAKGA